MKGFPKSTTGALQPVSPNEVQVGPEAAQCARRVYSQLCETLFELSYQIQRTGELPDPKVLTETVIQYQHVYELMQAIDAELLRRRNQGDSESF